MSTQPVLPLWIADYQADTPHLTMEESGSYLHLLMAMWARNGSIPNDDRDLMRICRMKPARWRKVKARLMPFLTITDDNCLTQKRLKKEWNRVHSGIQNRSPNRTENDQNRSAANEENQSVKPRSARGRARAFQTNPIKDKSEALLKGASSYPLANDLPAGASSAREAERHAEWLHKIAERNRPADPNHPTLIEAEVEQIEQYRRAKHLREKLKAAGFKGLRIIPP